MRLTSKVHYAVIATLDLALNCLNKPVVLADIAKRQKISQSYLEQLFAKLKRANLVISTRGPGGGYRLNRNVNEISIGDIITAVNEPLDMTRCHGAENCKSGTKCLTHHLWNNLSELIHDFLSDITVATLIKESQYVHSNSDITEKQPTPKTQVKKEIIQKKIDVTLQVMGCKS